MFTGAATLPLVETVGKKGILAEMSSSPSRDDETNRRNLIVVMHAKGTALDTALFSVGDCGFNIDKQEIKTKTESCDKQ